MLRDAAGCGLTARFEVDFLRLITDHHYSALRMTELAAGTDPTRDPVVHGPAEGTSPTPGYAATPAKAVVDDIQSMARMENRMQREEMQTALRYLREWYQLDHQPSVDTRGRRQVGMLDDFQRGGFFYPGGRQYLLAVPLALLQKQLAEFGHILGFEPQAPTADINAFGIGFPVYAPDC